MQNEAILAPTLGQYIAFCLVICVLATFLVAVFHRLYLTLTSVVVGTGAAVYALYILEPPSLIVKGIIILGGACALIAGYDGFVASKKKKERREAIMKGTKRVP